MVCRRTNGLGKGRAHSDSLRRARVNLLGSDKSREWWGGGWVMVGGGGVRGGGDDSGSLKTHVRITYRVCWLEMRGCGDKSLI